MNKFKRKIMSLGLAVMIVVGQVLGVASQPVLALDSFEDENLEKVIRAGLNVATGDVNLAELNYLNAEGISTTGLNLVDLNNPAQNNPPNSRNIASNLKVLNLKGNQIVTNSLTNIPIGLEVLYMSNVLNQPLDLANLSHLTNLKTLDLQNNKLTSVSALGNLTSLETLLLEGASFSFPSETRTLNNLKILKLGDNSLENLTGILVKTPALTDLYLGTNRIKDISILSNRTFLPALRKVDLGYNPLDESIDSTDVINNLRARNVTVTSTLAVTSPAKYTTTNLDTISITGLGRPNSNIEINNQSVGVGSNGEFNCTYHLTPGLNEINISLNENKTYTFKRYIVYDDSIVLTSPQNDFRTNDKVKIEGKSKIISGNLELFVNSRKVTNITTDINGDFSKEINLSNSYGTPNSNNTILVKGNIGGKEIPISRTIFYDRTNPVLTVASDNTLTNQTSVIISGTVTDNTLPVSVKINGASVSVNPATHYFEKTVYLKQGPNNIIILARDAVGNITEKIITVTSDTAPPKLSITSPKAPTTATQMMTYLISGTTEEDSTVKVNGEVIPNVKGNFSKNFELQNGNNEFLITATDKAGNVTTSSTKKIYSYAPSIDEPSDYYRTKNTSIVVKGKGSPGTTIKINKVDYKVPLTGVISKRVNLKPGIVNNITVEYITSKLTRHVISDNNVFFSLSSPLDKSYTNRSSIRVAGVTEADGNVNVKVNNVDKGNAINNNGNFSIDVDLNVGENNILITATDYVGNVITLQRKVFYDNTPPELVIYSPSDNVSIKESRVVGKAEPGSIVKINNQTITTDSNGYFDVNFKMNLGENNLDIVATDKAGNATSIKRNITLANTLSVNLTEPNVIYTNKNTVNINGSVNDKCTVKVNNNLVALNDNNSFNTQVTLIEGKNFITIFATDESGRKSEIIKPITLDTIKPLPYTIINDKYSSTYSPWGLFKLDFKSTAVDNGTPIKSFDIQWRTGNSIQWNDLGSVEKLSVIYKAQRLGLTYYFRIRPIDLAGNVGDWTANSYKTIIPYDESSLVVKKVGFKNRYINKKSGNFNGTLTSSVIAGEEITYRFTGDHVALIAAKGKNGAKGRLYVDGKYIGTVDTYASATKTRQVVFTKSWSKGGTHTLRIVNSGTKTRNRIDLDALAVGNG